MNHFFEHADCSIQSFLKEMIENAEKQALDRECVLLTGKYKGRLARVTSITVDRNGLLYLVQPYRIGGDGQELLWDDAQARTWRRQTEFKIIYDKIK